VNAATPFLKKSRRVIPIVVLPALCPLPYTN
jgi:hypothetical protein